MTRGFPGEEGRPFRMDSPYGSPGIVTFLPKVADDASPKFAGGRRPGKIWSAEAREDMFRRREAGEPWESICLVGFSPAELTFVEIDDEI